MSKRTWSLVLKAPALMLLIASFLAGIYAAIYNIQDMGWEVPIILGAVIFLYFIGSSIERSAIRQIERGEGKRKPVKKERFAEKVEPNPRPELDKEEDPF